MKTSFSLLLFVICLLGFSSCSDDDNNSDKIVQVRASVLHEYVEYYPPLGYGPAKGLKIKEEKSKEWEVITHISDFEYEEGYDYVVQLEKTYLADPPQDASSVTYKLIKVLEKTKH